MSVTSSTSPQILPQQQQEEEDKEEKAIGQISTQIIDAAEGVEKTDIEVGEEKSIRNDVENKNQEMLTDDENENKKLTNDEQKRPAAAAPRIKNIFVDTCDNCQVNSELIYKLTKILDDLAYCDACPETTVDLEEKIKQEESRAHEVDLLNQCDEHLPLQIIEIDLQFKVNSLYEIINGTEEHSKKKIINQRLRIKENDLNVQHADMRNKIDTLKPQSQRLLDQILLDLHLFNLNIKDQNLKSRIELVNNRVHNITIPTTTHVHPEIDIRVEDEDRFFK